MEDSILLYPERINRAISIHFCTRSGSYLLCSLLDHHPEVLSLPPVDFTPYIKTMREELKDLGEGVSLERLLNLVIENIPFIFRGWNASRKDRVLGLLFRFGASKCVVGTTVVEFRKNMQIALLCLRKRGELSFMNLLKAIYICYALCQKRKLDDVNPVLLLSLHQVDHHQIREFSSLFKSYHAFVCIRYPVVGFVSHLFHTLYEQEELPRAPILHHLNSFFNNSNSGEIPNFLGIKFEDIHMNTEKLMKKLANLIGIEWNPILLTSTCEGYTWWWRSGSSIKTGTNAKLPFYDIGGKVSLFDRLRYELLFEPHLKAWAYPYRKGRLRNLLKVFAFKLPFNASIYVLQKSHKNLPWHRKRGLLRREHKLIKETIERSRENNICNFLVL